MGPHLLLKDPQGNPKPEPPEPQKVNGKIMRGGRRDKPRLEETLNPPQNQKILKNLMQKKVMIQRMPKMPMLMTKKTRNQTNLGHFLKVLTVANVEPGLQTLWNIFPIKKSAFLMKISVSQKLERIRK